MNVKARVKMSLKAQLDEEMDLNIGDIVTILEETDKGWYRYVVCSAFLKPILTFKFCNL